MNTVTEADERNSSRGREIISSNSIVSNEVSANIPLVSPENYKEVLTNWMNKGIAYMFFFGILTLTEILEIPTTLSMFPLFMLDIKIAITKILLLKKKSIFKILSSKTIIHQLCSIVFKIMILIHIYQFRFRLIYLIVPITITSIYDLIQHIPKEQECKYLSWLIIAVCKWIFLFTIMNITLKLDKIVEWQWSGVLWPIYIGLCFCAVIIIGIGLFALGSLLSWLGHEITTKELISTIWLLISLIGATSSIIVLCMQITNPHILQLGKFYTLIPTIYLLIFNLVTMINMKNLVEWWTIFFTNNVIENIDSPISSTFTQSPQSFPRRITQAIKKAPSTLMRISSSYFQPADSPKKFNQKRTLSLKNVNEDEGIAHRRIFSNPAKIISIDQSSPGLQKICDMCCENTSDAVIMDCGHGGICYDCSLELWKTVGMCHMCRCDITQVLQIESTEKQIVKVCSTTKAVYCEE
ncbi:hypothetical protein SteCoe_11453 [Stentor coeruleus]|uniref:RING-type domain-containing protein n=1 Tax=Stentor coeruleus TaxID=5963 RepID=A0A1R2CD02_9CILI|nr:hypothetical protein SteCoe_11453 [Stentor coeruleus]